MNRDRWRKAQKAELSKWGNYSNRWQFTINDEMRRENLDHMCKYTSLSEDQLKNSVILEIGGSFLSRTFESSNIPPKVVLDPIFPSDIIYSQNNLSKSYYRLQGMGEYLPLRDKSIDMVWCENAIDHTSSPINVLREILRVLRNEGILIISCNIFSSWMKPFFPLLNILDRPHPHHFTHISFQNLLKQEFEIQNEFEKDKPLRISLVRSIKANIAIALGMKHSYFVCTPL